MNIPALFSALNQISLFQGMALGVTLAVLLTLTFVIRRWQVHLTFLAVTFIVFGIVLTGFFPAYYGLLAWITGLSSAAILALCYQQESQVKPAADPLTPMVLVGLISAPLLITALTGLLALWPAAQIGLTFSTTWVIFLFLGLSLWGLLRTQAPLPRTAAFICALAGLTLWQALRFDAPMILFIWATFTLITTFIGILFTQQTASLEIKRESG
ncbi:MAG: hypothetical protein QNJ45_20510 [Ardenticatenaceae bacterium]|nr:hypothetical protein [Ardenticatenaceae bacterium]